MDLPYSAAKWCGYFSGLTLKQRLVENEVTSSFFKTAVHPRNMSLTVLYCPVCVCFATLVVLLVFTTKICNYLIFVDLVNVALNASSCGCVKCGIGTIFPVDVG